MRPDHLAAAIDRALCAQGDRRRAAGQKKYLKSALRFYGVRLPVLRSVLTATVDASIDRRTLRTLVDRLWDVPVFERRMAVVELLDAHGAQLRAADISLVARLIRGSETWALVDPLAVAVAGGLVERYPRLTATMDRWARHKNFWLRRAAMLALLRPIRRGEGDFPRFARYADLMLDEPEFFIRKAIGWVLREASKKRPALVASWIEPRAARASGVTLREAVKYLPPSRRAAIARAARQPRA